MTCKYLTQKLKTEHEIGSGSPYPTVAAYFPGCQLDRDNLPDYLPEDCESANPNGPCPFWYPTLLGKSDPAFH